MSTYWSVMLWVISAILFGSIIVRMSIESDIVAKRLDDQQARLDELAKTKPEAQTPSSWILGGSSGSSTSWKPARISNCADDEVPVLLGVTEGDPRYGQWLCAKKEAIR